VELLEDRQLLSGNPVITAPATATVVEDGSVTFSAANGNAISAAYGATGTATVSFSIGAFDGTLTYKSTTGLTFINGTKNGGSGVNVSGTQAAINAALSAGVVYKPNNGFTGSDTLQLLAENSRTGAVGTATISVTVTTAPPPVISAPATATVVEDSSLTFSKAKGNAISVVYAAAGARPDSFSIGATDGTITLKSTTGLTFINGTTNGGSGVNVSGTSAAINAALGAGVVYQPNKGFTGSDKLQLLAENGLNAEDGTGTIPIVVTTAPPTVSVPPPATCVANDGSVYFSKSQNDPIVVADAGEVGNNADSMTLTVSHGTLSLNSANLIVTGLGTNSITAIGTPANFNVALDDLAYYPNGGFLGPTDSLKVTITDPVDNLSASKSVTIYITKWTTLTASSSSSEQPLSPLGLSTSLLLPNGDLMVLGSGPNGGPTNTWYEITPVNGSYADGTWTQLASMNQSRLYFSSDVLPNGDVFVFGGEFASDGPYNNGNGTQYSNSAEIFTPPSATNPAGQWTQVASDPVVYPANTLAGQTQPLSMGGDQPSEVLPNGSVLIGNIFETVTNNVTTNGTEIYVPQFNANGTPGQGSWETGPNKYFTDGNEGSDEESWVKLGNGDILTYDIFASQADGQGEAELYKPSTNGGIGQWVNASSGNLPILTTLANGGNELGPAMLLPNGNAFFAGPTGITADYDPSTGKWSQGPTLPQVLLIQNQFNFVQLGMDDGPAAVLPNGDLLLASSPTDTEPNPPTEITPGPTFILEFNPTTNVIENVTPPSSLIDQSGNSFVDSMLVLPNGQVMLTDQSATNPVFYTLPSADGPKSSWRPTITSFTQNADGSYTLTGTQLTGLDEGAAYGDDEQMAENYPLVRLRNINTNQHYYATTSNWSSTGVATGGESETVNVVLPTLPAGTYDMVVIVNGINSDAMTFVVPMAIHRVTSNSSAAVATESSAGQLTSDSSGAVATESSAGQLAPAAAPAVLESGDSSSPGPVGLVSSVPNVAPTSAFGLESDFSLDDSPPTIRPASSGSKTSTPVSSPPLQFDAALEGAHGVQWAGLIAALDILSA
jgi:hypothetical protein